MSSIPGVEALLDYTAWQRDAWREWFQASDAAALGVTTGANGDGRFATIGALVRHIFSAELRYVERIQGTPLTDTGTVPADDVDRLFALGERARAMLLDLLVTFPASRWDTAIEFPLMNRTVRLSPSKIVLHAVTHEIRHWAQVATLLRLQGYKVPVQDLLFAPVQGPPLVL